MNNYIMKFFNPKLEEWASKDTEQISFPEAVRAAYLQRISLGLNWEIVSVSKLNITSKNPSR